MAETPREPEKLTVFISYSRSDQQFADRLVAALEGRGVKCLIDRRDLEYGEKWQAVLRDFIRQADTVVYIVSPRSVGSQWCRWEAAEVAKLSKRLVPLVLEHVPPEELPPEIGTVHLMPFGPDTDFDAQVAALEAVLMTDREWVQEHTRLSGLALKWDAGARKRDGLLRGAELSEAEAWKQRPTRGKLSPDALVEAFISESRADAIRSQRIRVRISTAVAIGALALSGLAGWQAWRAVQNADLAEKSRLEATRQRDAAGRNEQVAREQRDRALLTQSRFLADMSRQATEVEKDPGTGLLLALEALRDASSDDEIARTRPYWAPAEVSLEAARRLLREQRVLAGLGRVSHMAMTPDRARIVVDTIPEADDGTVRVLDARTFAELGRVEGRFMALTPDGARIVTRAKDGTLRMWDARTLAELGRGRVEGNFAALTPDGAHIVTRPGWTHETTIRVWDATTFAELGRLKGHAKTIWSVAVTPDGARIITGSGDNTARVWDVRSFAELGRLEGHTGSVTQLAVAPDGARIITGSNDGTARVWDARSFVEIGVLRGHAGGVRGVTVTPDGARIVTELDDRTARVWDARTLAELGQLKGVVAVWVSPDSARMVTGHDDNTVRVWDARTLAELSVLGGHTSWVVGMAEAPDGRLVTGAYDRTVRVWDARSSARGELKGGGGSINSVAVTPDGLRVVTGSDDGSVRVWDARTFSEICALRGHTDRVRSVAVTPDGARIVSGSYDGTVRVWDARTFIEILCAQGPHRRGHQRCGDAGRRPHRQRLARPDGAGVGRPHLCRAPPHQPPRLGLRRCGNGGRHPHHHRLGPQRGAGVGRPQPRAARPARTPHRCCGEPGRRPHRHRLRRRDGGAAGRPHFRHARPA